MSSSIPSLVERSDKDGGQQGGRRIWLRQGSETRGKTIMWQAVGPRQEVPIDNELSNARLCRGISRNQDTRGRGKQLLTRGPKLSIKNQNGGQGNPLGGGGSQ